MTFPTGGPGGYPGQSPPPGYGPPQPGYGPRPGNRGGFPLGIGEIIGAVVALLGLVTLFLGFATVTPGVGFYESSKGWIPAVVATAGLLGALPLLPDKKGTSWSGLILIANLGAILPTLFTFFSGPELGVGAVFVMIFVIFQLLAAVALYLLDSGLIKLPVKGQGQVQARGGPGYGVAQPPGGYGQPGGYGPPPGDGYGPPGGGYGPPAGGSGPPSGGSGGPANQPTAHLPSGPPSPPTPPGGIGRQQG